MAKRLAKIPEAQAQPPGRGVYLPGGPRPATQRLTDFSGLSNTLSTILLQSQEAEDLEAKAKGRIAAEEDLRSTKGKFAQAVNQGRIRQVDSPAFREGYIEVTTDNLLRSYEDRVAQKLQEAVQTYRQVDPETGTLGPQRPIEELQAEAWNELTSGLNQDAMKVLGSTFARERMTRYRPQIDDKLQDSARAEYEAVFEGFTRDQTAAQLQDMMAGVDPKAPEALQDLTGWITDNVYLRSIQDPQGFVVASMMAQADRISVDDPEEAVHFLEAMGTLKVGPATLGQNSRFAGDIAKKIQQFENEVERDLLNLEAKRDIREKQVINDYLDNGAAQRLQEAFLVSPSAGKAELRKLSGEVLKDESLGVHRNEVVQKLITVSNVYEQGFTPDQRETEAAFRSAIALADFDKAEAAVELLSGAEAITARAELKRARADIKPFTADFHPYREALSRLDVEMGSLSSTDRFKDLELQEAKLDVKDSVRAQYRAYIPEAQAAAEGDPTKLQDLLSGKLDSLRKEASQRIKEIKNSQLDPFENVLQDVENSTRSLDFQVLERIDKAVQDGVLSVEQGSKLRANAEDALSPTRLLESRTTRDSKNALEVGVTLGTDDPSVATSGVLEAHKKFEDAAIQWWENEAPKIPRFQRDLEFRKFSTEKVKEILGVTSVPKTQAAMFLQEQGLTPAAAKNMLEQFESAATEASNFNALAQAGKLTDQQWMYRGSRLASKGAEYLNTKDPSKFLEWVSAARANYNAKGTELSFKASFQHLGVPYRDILENQYLGYIRGAEDVYVDTKGDNGETLSRPASDMSPKELKSRAARELNKNTKALDELNADLYSRPGSFRETRPLRNQLLRNISFWGAVKETKAQEFNNPPVDPMTTPMFYSESHLNDFLNRANSDPTELKSLLDALNYPYNPRLEDLSEDPNVRILFDAQRAAILRNQL